MKQFKTRIGIFDSGIGGFSILHRIIEKVPSVMIDYISDDAFSPYGEKTDTEIINRSQAITEMLLQRGCSLIVVACNSATAAAIKPLREKYRDTPFVGVEPYTNVLNHREHSSEIRKAAVITTELTGKSEKFRMLKRRTDPSGSILHISMPGLASTVESILETGLDESLMEELQKELEPLKILNLSHLILGCTHYPLIADLIEKELDVITVSSGPYVANRVFDLVSPSGSGGEYCSSFSYLSTSSMKWEQKTSEYLFSLLKHSAAKDGS
ncbi:MAG: aspartate/glutamate racemase family protein [Candidatus Fermentibacteria bacterium]|nr:aspartate/glutamate racemase family protein [Candidatus Fermentibacteria bacterium]